MLLGGFSQVYGWRLNPAWFILLEPVRARGSISCRGVTSEERTTRPASPARPVASRTGRETGCFAPDGQRHRDRQVRSEPFTRVQGRRAFWAADRRDIPCGERSGRYGRIIAGRPRTGGDELPLHRWKAAPEPALFVHDWRAWGAVIHRHWRPAGPSGLPGKSPPGAKPDGLEGPDSNGVRRQAGCGRHRSTSRVRPVCRHGSCRSGS